MKTLNKILLTTATLCAAVTPIATLTSCKHDPDPEVEQDIQWDSGWYSVNCESEGYAKSAVVQATFKLNKALAEGEELSVSIERVDAESTDDVRLLHEDEQGNPTITVFGTEVKIPLRLQKGSSYPYLGDHVVYNITFNCNKDKTLVWTKKIENCYLYMLLKPVMTPWTKNLGKDANANLDFSHEVNVSKEQTGVKFEISTEITKKSPEYLPLGLTNVGEVKYVDLKTHTQEIKWSDTSRMVAGDYVEFNVHLTITVLKLPDYPITFTFEGFKLIYQ